MRWFKNHEKKKATMYVTLWKQKGGGEKKGNVIWRLLIVGWEKRRVMPFD